MVLARPVLAAMLVAASGLSAAQAPAPLPAPDTRPGSTLPPPGPAAAAPLAGLNVMLDPGHGGADLGVQAGEYTEASLTLALATRVAAGLSAQGARCLLTRDADVELDADARALRANQAGAQLFLSFHLNRSPRPTVSGAEVYTHAAGEPGATSTPFTRWDQVQHRHAAASGELARLLAASLASRVPVSPVAQRQVPLRLLARVDMPAALVEVAYLSHPDQASAAGTPAFQTAVADAVVEALIRARQGASAP